jgi:hypothetical protein
MTNEERREQEHQLAVQVLDIEEGGGGVRGQMGTASPLPHIGLADALERI